MDRLRIASSVLWASAWVAVLSAAASAQLVDPPLDRGNFKTPERGSGSANGNLIPIPGEPPPLFGPKTAPFRVLDTVVGPYMNLNNVPFSPIALSANQNRLAAVNPHANLVRIFDCTNPNPANWVLVSSLKTAWGPTSCAFWESANCVPELLVTCSNSDALLCLAYDGRVEGLLGLPGEPSDLLVDSVRNVAWVSCMAEDVVVEVDLLAKKILRKYAIPSKHPAFLAFESGNTGAVLVAPMLSGNNTTVDRGAPIFNAGPGGILDLSTAVQGLPDSDLFRLSGGVIEPVVERAGTVLFAHEGNPVSGAHWMLGTDARNVALQSEPEAKGVFSENRLALVNGLPAPGNPPVLPTQTFDLDDADRILPGVQYVPTRTVGQPYALAFDSAGNGFVTGMLTDNVTMLDVNGNWVKEWNVGSIPRGLQTIQKGTSEFLAVFCWGASTVEIYQPALGTGLVATLSVGRDPTPTDVKLGRTIYYSASNSQHNNLSCNTCHVDGFADLLAWDLSDRRKDATGAHTVPVDDKGPLVTQTLRTLLGQLPYHWRGERADLIDFNGAFEGLLGGTKLDETPGGAFDEFEAFVFSLHERANPNEGVRRRVSDHLIPPSFPTTTSAVRGQDLFWDVPSIGPLTCQQCHALPSGTNNDTFRDEADAAHAGRSHFVVAPLMSSWRKLQPSRVQVEYARGVTDELPVLGVSLSATGLGDDLQDFMLQGGFDLGHQQRLDIAAFLMQLDTGIPPLMHEGVRIGYGSFCTPPTPLTAPSPGKPAMGALAGGSPSAGGAPATAALSPVPGTTPADAAELATNVATIHQLTQRAKRDHLDLVVVAELAGQKYEGVFDPEVQTFDLTNDQVTPVSLGKQDLLNALAAQDLVGMLFPMPRGMGDPYVAFDELAGPPPVVPGPGPTFPVAPGDEGEESGGHASTSPHGTSFGLGSSLSQNDTFSTAPPMYAMGNGPAIEGFEVVYATTRVAKLVFFTDVHATAVVEYTPAGGATQTYTSANPAVAHMVFLRDILPSKTYDLRLVVTGAGGSTELIASEAFTSHDLLQPNHVRVSALSGQAPIQDSGGTLAFTLDMVVQELDGDAGETFFPVLDVLVHDVTNDAWRVDQSEVSAPPTGRVGDSSLLLSIGGLLPGDVVLVKVVDIDPPEGQNYEWSLPDTLPQNRLIEVVYTGTGP